jgi:hypothetical protein
VKALGVFRAADLPLWAVGTASFIVATLASAPADLAVGITKARAPQLKVASTRGTLWKGEFVGASYADAAIGDVAFSVDPASLLTGRIAASLASRDGALIGKAKIEASASSIVVKDAAAHFNLSAIRKYTLFGIRYQGGATLKARRLSLSKSGCAAEEATLSTNALDALASRWSGGAFPLSGPIRCEDGKLVALLVGEGAAAAARIEISVASDLAYTMTVVAEPHRADVKDGLRLLGFETDGGALTWRTVGRLKGLTS